MAGVDLAAEGFPAEPPAHPVVHAEIGGRRCRLLLRIGDRIELERLTARGVQEINNRFALQSVGEAEIAETIRLGLIGGGECTPAVASAVVDVFIRPRLFDHVALALQVLLASVAGVEGWGEPGEAVAPGQDPATPEPSIASAAASG
ncbi:MAG: gene transfer agent family protein [Proteobacteria bacterium]|nr:gene transfer agent family protein [Pseudomonadota bacterium]